MWTLGIKTIENMLQIGFRNSRPLIFDTDFSLRSQIPDAHQNPSLAWTERLRVADQIAQYLHKPVLDRQDIKPSGRGYDIHARVVFGIAGRIVKLLQCPHDRNDINGTRRPPGHFRVDPRGVADIAD